MGNQSPSTLLSISLSIPYRAFWIAFIIIIIAVVVVFVVNDIVMVIVIIVIVVIIIICTTTTTTTTDICGIWVRRRLREVYCKAIYKWTFEFELTFIESVTTEI